MRRDPRVDRHQVLRHAFLRRTHRARAGRDREQHRRRDDEQAFRRHWYCDVSAGGLGAAASASTVWLARTTVTVHSDSATTVDDTLPR